MLEMAQEWMEHTYIILSFEMVSAVYYGPSTLGLKTIK